MAPEQNAFERKFSHASSIHSHVRTCEHVCRRSNAATARGVWFPRFVRLFWHGWNEFELYRMKAATWNTRLSTIGGRVYLFVCAGCVYACVCCVCRCMISLTWTMGDLFLVFLSSSLAKYHLLCALGVSPGCFCVSSVVSRFVWCSINIYSSTPGHTSIVHTHLW